MATFCESLDSCRHRAANVTAEDDGARIAAYSVIELAGYRSAIEAAQVRDV